MRCDDIRDRLDEFWNAELPAEVRAHLAGCAACSGYRRDAALLRAGLSLLKQEEAPAPSLGFAQRVVRKLSMAEAPVRVADFFELVGRRFVLVTLAVVFFAVLAITVPSSGPLHALSATDLQGPAQEATLSYSDPMGASAVLETPDAGTGPAPTSAVTNEVK